MSTSTNLPVAAAMRDMIQRILSQHGIACKGSLHLRLQHGPYLPLIIERIGDTGYGSTRHMIFSVCHYGELNGDAMRDPEIVYDAETWTPLYYRNDYLGQEQWCYPDPEHTHAHPNLKRMQDLVRHSAAWARELHENGWDNVHNFTDPRSRQSNTHPLKPLSLPTVGSGDDPLLPLP